MEQAAAEWVHICLGLMGEKSSMFAEEKATGTPEYMNRIKKILSQKHGEKAGTTKTV